ncbi:MAG TPA: AraC family transcriptional regulator ligand-binding domain-containing protein [Polyangiaceae bacterium]
MSDRGSLSVQALRGFLGLVALEGLDTAPVLAEAGVAATDLADIDGRLELPKCEALASAVMMHLAERQILRVFGRLKAGDFGILDYVIRNSRTLGESLERLARYHHVNNTIADCVVEMDPERARVSFVQPPTVSPSFVRLSASSWLASCVVIVRQLLGSDWAPIEALLPNPEPAAADRDAYRELLRCPLRFSAPAAVFVVPRSELARPVEGADPALVELMEPHLERALADAVSQSRAAGPVRRALISMLGGQEPTLDRVAKRLGTTPRTLQRRLRDESTTFQDLLDSVRHELALVHVGKQAASIDEIAWLLGFSNGSAFHRAFKRWTGVTPGEFRRHS